MEEEIFIVCPWCLGYTKIPDIEETNCPICGMTIRKEDFNDVHATITADINSEALSTETENE